MKSGHIAIVGLLLLGQSDTPTKQLDDHGGRITALEAKVLTQGQAIEKLEAMVIAIEEQRRTSAIRTVQAVRPPASLHALRKVTVLGASLLRLKEGALLQVTFENQTSHAISRIYFHGVYKTPGRTIAWIQGDFEYEIRGGLEPGEKATWRASGSKWKRELLALPKAAKDAVLTAAVVAIKIADGRVIGTPPPRPKWSLP